MLFNRTLVRFSHIQPLWQLCLHSQSTPHIILLIFMLCFCMPLLFNYIQHIYIRGFLAESACQYFFHNFPPSIFIRGIIKRTIDSYQSPVYRKVVQSHIYDLFPKMRDIHDQHTPLRTVCSLPYLFWHSPQVSGWGPSCLCLVTHGVPAPPSVGTCASVSPSSPSLPTSREQLRSASVDVLGACTHAGHIWCTEQSTIREREKNPYYISTSTLLYFFAEKSIQIIFS